MVRFAINWRVTVKLTGWLHILGWSFKFGIILNPFNWLVLNQISKGPNHQIYLVPIFPYEPLIFGKNVAKLWKVRFTCYGVRMHCGDFIETADSTTMPHWWFSATCWEYLVQCTAMYGNAWQCTAMYGNVYNVCTRNPDNPLNLVAFLLLERRFWSAGVNTAHRNSCN